MSTTDEITGRALDGLVAENVMGWQWREQVGAAPDHKRSSWLFNPAGRIQDIPAYSTDIAAAHQVEDAIYRRGLITEYITALVALIDPAWSVYDDSIVAASMHTNEGDEFLWLVARATPRQRSLAALAAVGYKETQQ